VCACVFVCVCVSVCVCVCVCVCVNTLAHVAAEAEFYNHILYKWK
jgi:hypothetical protein